MSGNLVFMCQGGVYFLSLVPDFTLGFIIKIYLVAVFSLHMRLVGLLHVGLFYCVIFLSSWVFSLFYSLRHFPVKKCFFFFFLTLDTTLWVAGIF